MYNLKEDSLYACKSHAVDTSLGFSKQRQPNQHHHLSFLPPSIHFLRSHTVITLTHVKTHTKLHINHCIYETSTKMDAFEEGFVATEGGTDEQIMQPPSHPFEEDGYIGSYDYDAAPPPLATATDDYDYDGGAPPPQTLPMDDFSDHAYGISQNNNEYDNGGSDRKGYDLGADADGIFSSDHTHSDGPILPDPSQMREEGAAFREWRR